MKKRKAWTLASTGCTPTVASRAAEMKPERPSHPVATAVFLWAWLNYGIDFRFEPVVTVQG